MKGRGLRPAQVRPAAGLLGMAVVLYLAGRASGAGWVVVLLCAVLGLLVLAVVWPAWALLGSEVELVEVPRDATARSPARVTVRSRGRGPGMELRLILAGGTGEARRAGPGPARGQLSCVPAQRGGADHLVVEAMAGGPLGLFQWSRRYRFDLDPALEVGPARLGTDLDPLTTGASGDPQARAATRPGHDLPRGVRAYQTGDSFRLLHWPATARWGHPMVRETEDPDPAALVVVADLSGPAGPAETAASLAAGLAEEALTVGRAVVLSTSEAGGGRLAPVRSPAEVGRRLARAGAGAPPAPPAGSAAVRVDVAFVSAWEARQLERAGPTAVRGRPRQSLGDRLRRVNARQPAEEGVGLRLAAGVASGTAAASVLAQGVGDDAFRLAVMAGLALGFAFAWRTRHRPGYGTKTVLALGSIVVLVWFLKMVSGIAAGLVSDAETPLAELLVAVQVLQSFDATARRDLVFSVYITLPVMAAAGILSVSMALWPYLALWSLAAMTVLLMAHQQAGLDLGALAPEDHGSGSRSASLHLAPALLLTLAAGLGLFLVVPAAGTTQPLVFPAAFRRIVTLPIPGILDNPSLGSANPAGGLVAESRRGQRVAAGPSPFGYFGFSTQLDLAARGRPDNTLVMRVRASHPALWLGQTFDRWNGRTWSISDLRALALPARPPIEVPLPVQDGLTAATGPDFVQTFYVLQPGPNLIFGADPVSQVYLAGGRVDELSDGTLRADEELGPGTVYTVVSQPALVTAATLRAADRDPVATPKAITRRYGYVLPTTARVRQLAAQVTAGAATTYDKILALEAWMGRHTRYSLDPPPLPAGADAVDQFLFVSRQGFCEQIATSLVVMLRSLHIPSRLAVGYAPGTRNPFTGMYDITASDAHAWAEVWFPGIGWEPFDPTAQVPLSGDAGQSAAAGLQAYLVHGLGAGAVPAEAGVGAAALAGLLVALGLPVIRRRIRRTNRSAPGPSAPSWARACQERLETWGAARGSRRRPSETLDDYLARLGPHGPPPRTGTLIERSAFSASGLSAQDARWVEEVLVELEATEPVTEHWG